MRLVVLAALCIHAVLGVAASPLHGCTDGISCETMHANGLDFDCRFAAPEESTEDSHNAVSEVMLLHGFPEWSAMWMPLMRSLSAQGYRSVACNLRGYSSGARPSSELAYNYNILGEDVWALADAANFSQRFHLIGHDHGALLGWTVAASSTGSSRLQSYTALSIPHPRAFSDGLYGPHADVEQQVASQYFSMFTMNNSATMNMGMLYHGSRKSKWADADTFNSATDFQKALWWYNGVFAAGAFSMPPLFSATDLLLKYKNPVMAGLRKAFPGCDQCKAHPEGFPAHHPVANVTVPSLFICGVSDSAILCARNYSLRTKEFVSNDYNYMTVQCGHDVLTEGTDCPATEVAKVTEAILARMNR